MDFAFHSFVYYRIQSGSDCAWCSCVGYLIAQSPHSARERFSKDGPQHESKNSGDETSGPVE